jgi:hypothetical protein
VYSGKKLPNDFPEVTNELPTPKQLDFSKEYRIKCGILTGGKCTHSTMYRDFDRSSHPY